MRSRQWFRLRWPTEVPPERLLSALANLNGAATPRRREVTQLISIGRGGRVTHHLAVPGPRSGGARHQLEAAMTGLTAEPVDPPALGVDRVWRAWFSCNDRPLDAAHADSTARGLLTALASARDDELLVLRWVLGRVHRPRALPAIGNTRRDLGLGLPDWVTEGHSRGLDAEARRALTAKQGVAGWHAALHFGVAAEGRRRQRELLGRVASAVRVAQAPGAQVGFRPSRKRSLVSGRLPRRRPLLVNIEELRALASWPIGLTEDLPVARERSRLLPASPVSGSGRVVAEATYPGGRRLLTLSAADAMQHLHVLGPTGVGKSTLLLNLICQDIEDGRGVVVIEPRGDLVADVLKRIPESRLGDVVVIDPTDPAPVGVNPLAASNLPSELRVDHLLTVFKRLWIENWGPRTQDILTAGLLTIADADDLSLVALPALFSDREFRRELVARIHDPLGVDSFWNWFDGLTDSERSSVLAPVMNKLRAFLLRPSLRRVIGQSQPKFDLRDVFRARKVVLVNLATGLIGPESATLLGSLIVSHLWQTILGRTAVAADRRHPVLVYVDEWQSFVHLPTDLAEVLAQARGLGVGLTLAHQHLAQLRPDLRSAVLANARSRVVFAQEYEDASILVRGIERLTAGDVMGLGRYEIYASLLADGESTPYASGRTLPPPEVRRSGDDVRELSRRSWGVAAHAIDDELEQVIRSDGRRLQHADRPAQAPEDGIVALPDRWRPAA